MAAIDENALVANGVVHSQGKELHCAICPIELNSENWKAHIDDPSHIGALRQFNLVFVVNSDKINCKVCNMIFDWETLRNHAIWHKIEPWYVNAKLIFLNKLDDSNDGKKPDQNRHCAELRENEKRTQNSEKSSQSISSLIDNEPTEKPINPKKAGKITFQSKISRSQSLTHSGELPSSSDCHETMSPHVTNNDKEFPSDGNAKFRSASNCEILGKRIDPEANMSTKNSSDDNSIKEPMELGDGTENGSLKAYDSQSLRPYDLHELSSSKKRKIAENLSSSLSTNLIGISEGKHCIPETSRQKELTIIFDYPDDYIHDMKGKLREIEKGFHSCFIDDSNETYCIICGTAVVGTVDNYHEHLWSLQHGVVFDCHESDHAAVKKVPGRYSELDFAFEYMMPTTKNFMYCHICKINMDEDDAVKHRYHMNDKIHRENVSKMHDRVKNAIAIQSQIKCDWYKVFQYICGPCNMNFESEITFDKHLKSDEHSSILKTSANTDRTMFFDYCSPCALLWYGCRFFYTYHCDIPTHKLLMRDENHLSPQLPISANRLLAMSDEYIEDNVKYSNDTEHEERKYFATLIRDVEKTAKLTHSNAKAYRFGSRAAGLDTQDRNFCVFLDCANGNCPFDARMSVKKISESLNKDTQTWVSIETRFLNIEARHRETGLYCRIQFWKDPYVKATRLISSINDAYPACRWMIIFFNQWLNLCGLSDKLCGQSGNEFDASCWFVIFYLQNESILPSIATMFDMRKKSHSIPGETTSLKVLLERFILYLDRKEGVHRKFICIETPSRGILKELLIGFFTFYANFDYRRNVACPWIGEAVKKQVFTTPKELPKQTEPHVKSVKSDESSSFQMDSPMCLQHPFELTNNLTKSMSKISLCRFRTFCSRSVDVLNASSSQ